MQLEALSQDRVADHVLVGLENAWHMDHTEASWDMLGEAKD
jgi:hypothetical protein